MDTRHRGDIAEAAVLARLTHHGLRVWMPWSRFGSADLVAETPDGRFVRIQVKSGRIRGGCVIANSRSTDHGGGRKTYDGLVDVIAVHVPELGEQFVVDVRDALGFEIRLRLDPTRNNQSRGVRFAREHRLDDWAAAQVRPCRVVSPAA